LTTNKYCHASTCNAAAAAGNGSVNGTGNKVVAAGAVTTAVSSMMWILPFQLLAFAGMH
jgi:hypothetical protein